MGMNIQKSAGVKADTFILKWCGIKKVDILFSRIS